MEDVKDADCRPRPMIGLFRGERNATAMEVEALRGNPVGTKVGR